MPTKKDAGRVSDAALKKSTGKTWAQWKTVLSTVKGKTDKKSLVAAVKKAGVKDAWWCDAVATGFLHMAKSSDDVQMKDDHFIASAQKVYLAGVSRVWDALTGVEGRKMWLGTMAQMPKLGEAIVTDEGMQGVMQDVTKEKVISFTIAHSAKHQSTVHIQVQSNHGKTLVRLDHEGLRNKKEREERRRYWQSALDRIGHFFIIPKEPEEK
jgi:uncharacterized protein YndB with AHSA1/START domain